MPFAVNLPAHQRVEEAAALVRQATTLADYLDARESFLEALHAALSAEAEFWGF